MGADGDRPTPGTSSNDLHPALQTQPDVSVRMAQIIFSGI